MSRLSTVSQSVSTLLLGKKKVLVIGATGKQGGAVVTALLTLGTFEVFALSRNPESAAALALADKGVTVLKGDLNDKESLEAALTTSKVAQVFLVTDFWVAAQSKEDLEVLHGTNMIDAVKAVDPSIFVVFSSVGDADKTGPDVHHFVAKARIETYLAESLGKWSVIRPVCFLENLDDPAAMNPLTKGKVKMIIPPEMKMKYVSTIDIGKAAANILAKPSLGLGLVQELATCEYGGPELAAALTEASGTPCTYGVALPKLVMRLVAADLFAMVTWFETTNYSADVAKGRALVGPTFLDAKAWFELKGQWANGVKFGAPDPPSTLGKVVSAVSSPVKLVGSAVVSPVYAASGFFFPKAEPATTPIVEVQ